jgi:mono/diheme cytochrome c family protein
VPKYAIPVLAALPLWALVYAGTLVKPASALDPELELGQKTYQAACSGCHGSRGEGGTGRPLGQVLQTFPNKADHLLWIMNGSPVAGTPYGDPKRPGGQRIAGSDGYTTRMPAFKDSLSPEEIAAVARYEREVIGGGEAQPSTADDLDPKPSAGSGEAQGEQNTGTSSSGSATDQAQSSGGDVGGNNPEGGSSDASPSSGGSGNTQTTATTTGGSKAGGGTGSGTGGDTTSTTGG